MILDWMMLDRPTMENFKKRPISEWCVCIVHLNPHWKHRTIRRSCAISVWLSAAGYCLSKRERQTDRQTETERGSEREPICDSCHQQQLGLLPSILKRQYHMIITIAVCLLVSV